MPDHFKIGEYASTSGKIVKVEAHHVTLRIDGAADVRINKGGAWIPSNESAERSLLDRRNPPHFSSALAHEAGWDAGNRSMTTAGRKTWNEDDYNAAVREYERLRGGGDERCPIHPDALLIKTCPKCLGAAGGRSTSPAKIAASRANAKLGAKLGGRPPNHTEKCDALTTGRSTRGCPRCRYDRKKVRVK